MQKGSFTFLLAVSLLGLTCYGLTSRNPVSPTNCEGSLRDTPEELRPP